MSEDQIGFFNLTAPVVMAFPNLFVPKAFKGTNGKELGDAKYSGNFIFPPDSPDLKDMKALAVKIARASRPTADLKTLAFPFRSGDKLADAAKAKKKDGEYQRGKVVISARSKYQPKLANFQNGKIVDLDEQGQERFKSQFYPGVLVYVSFNFVWHDEVGGNPAGVNAYLQTVLTTNKGERLAGGKTASEVFSGYVGNVSAEDPTTGNTVDDEIPF